MSRLSSLGVALLSPSIRSAALFAFTGLGFAGANLILAKALPTLDYALLTLIVSLLSLAVPLAPFGADGVINRQLLNPDNSIFKRSLWVSGLVAVATAVIGSLVYDIDRWIVLLMVPGIVAGGATMVASAFYQRFHRFTVSLLLAQSYNLFFISASLLVFLGVFQGVWFPIALIVSGFVITAVWSWSRLLRRMEYGASDGAFIWREALHYTGVNAAGLVMLQLERLLIPKVLSLAELASFGVLAAVVIAPYRTLQMGVAFSVLPRLRSVKTVAGRRRLIVKEIILLGSLVAAGSVALYWVASPIFEFLFLDKYRFPQGLIIAAIVTGCIRVLGGLSKGVATAVCTTGELALLNTLIWISVGVAIIGGAMGAHWGLTGLLYGIGLGWIARVAFSAYVSWPHIRRQPSCFKEQLGP